MKIAFGFSLFSVSIDFHVFPRRRIQIFSQFRAFHHILVIGFQQMTIVQDFRIQSQQHVERLEQSVIDETDLKKYIQFLI